VPVVLIETREAFVGIQDDWQRLYGVDDESSVFLSWRWMYDLIMKRDEKPCILAWYRDDAISSDHERSYEAFLPLRQQLRLSKSRGEFYLALSFAGNYWADYTGVLCHPQFQAQAISELGEELVKLKWRRLFLESIRQSSARIEALFGPVKRNENCKFKPQRMTDNDGNTDLGKAPVVTLPSTFENWMQDSLSSNTRQKIRRFRRRLNDDSRFCIRLSTEETREQDIATFQTLWTARWAQSKGRHVDILAKKYVELVREGIAAGDMILLVLTDNAEAVALHACYVDPVRRVLSFFVGARKQSFSTLAPGLVVHAHAIEWAIDRQFVQYDLLRGDESYKYSLGALDQTIESFWVTRRNLPVEHRFLEFEYRDKALQLLKEYQRKISSASHVHDLYSQLLESWPGDAFVLKQYAAWLETIDEKAKAAGIHRCLSEETSALLCLQKTPNNSAFVVSRFNP
jgi:CelD/BcsL family acetyltransferase involved in cellulose biosynthesis